MNKQVQAFLLMAVLFNSHIQSSGAIEPAGDPAIELIQDQDGQIVMQRQAKHGVS